MARHRNTVRSSDLKEAAEEALSALVHTLKRYEPYVIHKAIAKLSAALGKPVPEIEEY